MLLMHLYSLDFKNLTIETMSTQIQRAREDAEHLRQDIEAQAQAIAEIEDEFDPDKRERKYTLQHPDQVLVRLKVEHSGFTTLNNQRFGSRFVGEVVRAHLLSTAAFCLLSSSSLNISHRIILHLSGKPI